MKYDDPSARINYINKHLMGLLGSKELVEKWWDSPNKNWDLKTPREVYEQNGEEVFDYVIFFCYH